MILPLVILVRVLANPLSNVFQKLLTRRSADPLVVIGVTHALLSVACLPLVLRDDAAARLGGAFWGNMAAVAVLTVAGNALLVAAVRRSDLSVLGPVNAYKAVVSLVPGLLLLGEVPGPAGLGGIGLIVAGSYFLVDRDPATPRANPFVRFLADRGVQYRFAALALSATEAVFLKRALLASGSAVATFAFWAILGFAAAAPAVAVRVGACGAGREWRAARASAGTYGMLAATTGLMQFCTIVTFGGFQVGYALALFQTSSIVSVLLGYKVFRERNIAERLVGSVIMVAGAGLIVVAR